MVSATIAAGSTEVFLVYNSFVSSSSKVFVNLRRYNGAYNTNGHPIVSLEATVDGNFIVGITNIHASNALNGTLEISFLVLEDNI